MELTLEEQAGRADKIDLGRPGKRMLGVRGASLGLNLVS